MKNENITNFTYYRDKKELEVLEKIHELSEKLEAFDIEEMKKDFLDSFK